MVRKGKGRKLQKKNKNLEDDCENDLDGDNVANFEDRCPKNKHIKDKKVILIVIFLSDLF